MSTQLRRQADESVHAFQHRCIEERHATAVSVTADRKRSRHAAREARKHAVWTLRGHLQQFHQLHDSYEHESI